MILIGTYRSPVIRRIGATLVHYGIDFEHRDPGKSASREPHGDERDPDPVPTRAVHRQQHAVEQPGAHLLRTRQPRPGRANAGAPGQGQRASAIRRNAEHLHTGERTGGDIGMRTQQCDGTALHAKRGGHGAVDERRSRANRGKRSNTVDVGRCGNPHRPGDSMRVGAHRSVRAGAVHNARVATHHECGNAGRRTRGVAADKTPMVKGDKGQEKQR